MCARFEEWKDEIRKYCVENNLNFEMLCNSVKGFGPQFLVLQQPKSDSLVNAGLNDETPLPVLLWITKQGDNLTFEQTEHTKRVLAN